MKCHSRRVLHLSKGRQRNRLLGRRMPPLITSICNTHRVAAGRLAGVIVYVAGTMLASAAQTPQSTSPYMAASPAPYLTPQSDPGPPAAPFEPGAGKIMDKPATLELLAANFGRTPEVIVAEVAGTPITLGMVADTVRDLPPNWGAAPPKQVFNYVLKA